MYARQASEIAEPGKQDAVHGHRDIQRQRLGPRVPKTSGSGRQLPEGLRYIDSWVESNFARCFQLMETDDLRALQTWVLGWRGTGIGFESVPVLPSAATRQVVGPHL